MAILLPVSLSLFPSPPQTLLSSSPIAGASAGLAISLQWRSLKLSSFPHHKKTQILTRASSEASGEEEEEEEAEKEEEEEEPTSILDLPRESKQQEMDALKANIQLNRKLRRRRWRLMRKRILRKKGQWPMSKMKKNAMGGKNVKKHKKGKQPQKPIFMLLP